MGHGASTGTHLQKGKLVPNYVWYIGTASRRVISSADWASLGQAGAQKSVWESVNGYTIPESQFTAPQLALLSSMSDFRIGMPSTPRDMSQVMPKPSEFRPVDSSSAYLRAMQDLWTIVQPQLSAVVPQGVKPIWAATTNSQAKPVYPTCVAIGDSFSAGFYGVQLMPYPLAGYSSASYLGAALTKSRWPCTMVSVGTAGEQANAGLARFDADVLSKKPAGVFIEYGSNDIALGRSAVATFADQQAMALKAWKSGAFVVITTVPPRSTFTTAQMKEALKLNSMIRNFGRTNPKLLAILDFWSALADPSTGMYISGYSDDGVHPNSLGCNAIAKKADPIFQRFFPNPQNTLAASNTNDDNLLLNPMFLTSGGVNGVGNSGTVANGWVVYGSDSSVLTTASLIDRAGTDGFGKWQQINNTAGGAGKTFSMLQVIQTGFSVGDILQGSVEFETDSAGWVNGAFNLLIICQTTGGAATTNYLGAFSPDAGGITKARPDNGILQTPPFVVPATTAQILFAFQKTDLGVVRLGRAALRKLPVS